MSIALCLIFGKFSVCWRPIKAEFANGFCHYCAILFSGIFWKVCEKSLARGELIKQTFRLIIFYRRLNSFYDSIEVKYQSSMNFFDFWENWIWILRGHASNCVIRISKTPWRVSVCKENLQSHFQRKKSVAQAWLSELFQSLLWFVLFCIVLRVVE